MSGSLNMPGAPGQNTGHGHVFPRPDRARARCGGPRLCDQCRADESRKTAPVDWPARFRAAAEAVEGFGAVPVRVALRVLAKDLEHTPPHVVEAIGRALLGEDGTDQ
jgi:hypothetical protein